MAEPVGGWLSAALKATYTAAGVSQAQIAEYLGVEQPAVSRWVRGARRVPLDVLGPIEELCRVPKGTILRRAGYVEDDPTDLEAAINAHPQLDASTKRLMLILYRDSLGDSVTAPSTRESFPKVPIQSSI